MFRLCIKLLLELTNSLLRHSKLFFEKGTQHLDLIRMFREYGADLRIKNDVGKDVFDLIEAAESGAEGSSRIGCFNKRLKKKLLCPLAH